MYESFYNLKCLAFENLPDPRFMYESDQHREALASIEYIVRMRKGLVLLSGGVGCGKTVVSQGLCQKFGDNAAVIHLSPGHETKIELIGQLIRSLGFEVDAGHNYSELLEILVGHLKAHAGVDRPVVLIADEAQSLSDESLEEVRLLTNLESGGVKLLQIILVGQGKLRDRLQGPRLTPLRQRVVMSKHLRPFTLDETFAYIKHRVAVARGIDVDDIQTPVFDDVAIQGVYTYSNGVARVINIVCDNCMLYGFVNKIKTIDARMVSRVISEMVPACDHSLVSGRTSKPRFELSRVV